MTLVDRNPAPARLPLAGGATPTSAPTHSGAGLIVRLRMRPMSLAEQAPAAPAVSLRASLTGWRSPVASGAALSVVDYAEQLVAPHGNGSKGPRESDWAIAATAQPREFLLIRG